jgi:PAS domain S-box-containing protein
VWVSADRFSQMHRPWRLPLFIGVCSLAALLMLGFDEHLPGMTAKGAFTVLPIAANGCAGVAFLMAAVRFGRMLRVSRDQTELIFLVIMVLLGLSGLTFPFSVLWDLNWWLWHLLRLAAFLVALLIIIQEYKTMVARLQTSETRLQAIVQSTSDWIWELDADGIYTYCSQGVEKVLGYSPKDILGRTPFDLMLPEKQRQVGKQFSELVTDRAPIQNLENWNLAKDGRRVCLLTNGLPIFDDHGRLSGYRGANQDITLRKQIEDELKKSEERFRALFESTTDCILVWDRDYNYLFANQAAIDHVGTTRDKVIGKSIRDGLGHVPDFMRLWMDRVDSVFASEKSMRVEDAVPVGDQVIHSESILSPMKGPDGNVFAVGVVYRDITQRKQLETQLQIRNKALERSNAELDDFAYIVSHDLKEPLRSIHSFASFLLEDYRDRLDNEGRSHLDIVMQSSRRMANLLDDLLIYSRVGRTELAMQPTNLGRVVARVVEDFESLLTRSNAVVTVDPDLPTVSCDNVRIGAVFRNLIENAVKYNDAEEKQVEVGWRPTHGSENGSPVVFVRDNGIGIREKHQSIVFKIFKRLHGRDKYGGGTGAGLTIVSKIIARHGGRVWVESEFGKGSTFCFTFHRMTEKRPAVDR